MQLYVSVNPDLPDGGPYVNMNPGNGKPFGVIEFGDNAYVSVKSDDEARRIIAAAAALIEMRKMLGTPHEFEPAPAMSVVEFSHCARCGMLEDSPDHAELEGGGLHAEPMQASCRCGHAEDAHHLDMVNDKSTHCNACNACDKFAVAGTRASVSA